LVTEAVRGKKGLKQGGKRGLNGHIQAFIINAEEKREKNNEWAHPFGKIACFFEEE